MLRSLIFIKPIREGHAFFMIRLNAVDRPETGHTHSSGPCSVTGQIPALFYAVFWPNLTVHGVPVTELYYIFAMVAELGDGLATPVDLYTATYILRLVPCMEVAQRVHMIAESPVASPPPPPTS